MTVMAYRTQDGLADYGFSIEFMPDVGWRIYIIFMPGHQSDNKSPQFPYQSIDRNGRHYVDWSARIDTLGEAKVVAELWAELTRHCQHTGAQATTNDAITEAPNIVQQQRPDAA